MIITRIEEEKGKRYRVFGDDHFLFSLYNKELNQFKIRVDADIDEAIIKEILDNVIYKRARERALYLLERRPFSIQMMKNKLYQNDYPEMIVEQVILFLKRYHYLDDMEYVSMYVNTYATRKSKRQLICDLTQKGISKDNINEYFSENDFSEQECFLKQFHRYVRGKHLEDFKTRQKVFQYFYRKGFSQALIERYIRETEY